MYRVKVELKHGVIAIEADSPEELQNALAAAVHVLDSRSTPQTQPRVDVAESPSVPVAEAAPTEHQARLSVAEQPAGRKLDYRSARVTADFLYLALVDLGSLQGQRAYTPQAILDHVLATGGDPRIRAKEPLATVRQALRHDERFVRDGKGYKAIEWLPKHPEPAASSLLNVSQTPSGPR